MKINDIKPENRPIEKMTTYGSQTLSNEELLAILINTGTKTKSSIDISYEIINSVSCFSDILNLSIPELMRFNGIKKAKACRIEAAFELTKRLMSYSVSRQAFIEHSSIAKFIYPKLTMLESEHLLVIYLDNKCRMISYEENTGGINSVNIFYNEIIKSCIKLGARGVIVSHNHPSGDSTPSKADINSTNELSDKLDNFNLILFDHIVIGKNEYFSFSENLKFGIKF